MEARSSSLIQEKDNSHRDHGQRLLKGYNRVSSLATNYILECGPLIIVEYGPSEGHVLDCYNCETHRTYQSDQSCYTVPFMNMILYFFHIFYDASIQKVNIA